MLVEQTVYAALTDTFNAAQRLVIDRLGAVTVEQLGQHLAKRH